MFVAAMIFTRRLICLLVRGGVYVPENFLSTGPPKNISVESCENVEVNNNKLKKKLSKAFTVQECDANEDDLCTEVGFIKNKNTHNSPLLLYCAGFTQKITIKF